MLRRINAALYEAPLGARIQIIVEAQDNNGVEAARFQYGTDILTTESILGHPGCSFTVSAPRRRLEAAVVFSPAAGASARYDLFEVENGIPSDLGKSVSGASASPLVGFAIEPLTVSPTVGPPTPGAGVLSMQLTAARKPARQVAGETAGGRAGRPTGRAAKTATPVKEARPPKKPIKRAKTVKQAKPVKKAKTAKKAVRGPSATPRKPLSRNRPQ